MFNNKIENSPFPEVIELNIPAKPEFLNIMRLTIAGIGERMGFSVDDIEDIKIAIGEVCINVIHHAYKDVQGEALIYIKFFVYPDKLGIAVKDSGKGADQERVEKYLKSTGREKVEGIGLGMYLMKTLMDEVNYKSLPDGNEVRMVKRKVGV